MLLLAILCIIILYVVIISHCLRKEEALKPKSDISSGHIGYDFGNITDEDRKTVERLTQGSVVIKITKPDWPGTFRAFRKAFTGK